MCLGIPGQIMEIAGDGGHLATVDVSGVHRSVNVALLTDEQLGAGDWVLVHVGFAMSKIDEQEAANALASLHLLGGTFTEELDAFLESPSGDGDGSGARSEPET